MLFQDRAACWDCWDVAPFGNKESLAVPVTETAPPPPSVSKLIYRHPAIFSRNREISWCVNTEQTRRERRGWGEKGGGGGERQETKEKGGFINERRSGGKEINKNKEQGEGVQHCNLSLLISAC